uniref:UBX domain-containing protein n=1 Tax=Caenorhabditis tropicalis TaxID=1561998 RepID=A0A1I7UTS7_9PELO
MPALTRSQQKKVESFMEMANCQDESTAMSHLSESKWDLDEAVLQFALMNVSDDSSDDDEEYMEIDECDFPLTPVATGKLFPNSLDDVPAALRHFSEEFGKRYPGAPSFFTGTLDKALELSKEVSRPVLLFLTNDKQVSMNIFCSSIMCNPSLASVLSNGFVLFPWDVSDHQNLSPLVSTLSFLGLREISRFINQLGSGDSLPALIPFVRLNDIPTFCQSSDTLDHILAMLYGAAEDFRMLSRSQAEIQREREEREMIRRIQEEEYQASLAADLAKMEKKRQVEEEKRRKIEEEEKEMKRKIEEAERAKAEEEARKDHVARELPSEPAANEKEVIQVKFRLPEGKMTLRRFRQGETIGILVQYLSSIGYQVEKYKFFNSDFPKKNIMGHFDTGNTFTQAKWPAREQIFVEEI